ncbi:phage portal protein [Micromonospora carbonacea]|uniref:Phage portal protein, SPP1 Gp6-like n=1 Tax=Micromonospora carbonacea TaxID=47853 RepID=A0A1C5A2C4_9ACTN|nr:phage portal protein [Micromonospora carbonacea]SCF39373.1 Phage portal protein, SPP1 Gp6-like [Micromonospora carbonacea]
MALTDDERATLGRMELELLRAQRRNRRLDAYYNGEQRLEQLGLAVPPELQRFLTIVAWPGTYADAIEERIDLEGFRLPGATDADEDLWRIWQANGLDEESQLAHLDALVLGRSFITVGSGDDTPDAPSAEDGDADRDPAVPLVTVESANEVTVERDPRTRRVVAAAKVYQDGPTRRATLYLPDQTVWLERESARWSEQDRDVHDMGVVPVVPITNRPRLARREGRSQFERVIGLTDAAARAVTNAQLATEIMAIPQRYVLGASKGDFVDSDGKQLTAWEAYFGAIWALANKDAKVGSFSAADLANFKTIVDHYASLVAGLTGLPMRYLGQSTTNPPSAEGIRADESRIIKTCERFARSTGGSWELAMRIVRRIIDGDWDPRLAQMETLWRDPATPTKAQQADAAVKLVQAGILPVEAAWEDMGYSAVRRGKLAAMRAAERSADPILEIARGLPAQQASGEPVPADVGS